jgi:hypothetical protein
MYEFFLLCLLHSPPISYFLLLGVSINSAWIPGVSFASLYKEGWRIWPLFSPFNYGNTSVGRLAAHVRTTLILNAYFLWQVPLGLYKLRSSALG